MHSTNWKFKICDGNSQNTIISQVMPALMYRIPAQRTLLKVWWRESWQKMKSVNLDNTKWYFQLWTLLVLTSREANYVNLLFDRKLFTKIPPSRNQNDVSQQLINFGKELSWVIYASTLVSCYFGYFLHLQSRESRFPMKDLPCLKSYCFYLFTSISIVLFIFDKYLHCSCSYNE